MAKRLFLPILCSAFIAFACGCADLGGDGSNGDQGGGTTPSGDTPPDQPTPPGTSTYKRGSLAPEFQLTPSAEFGRLVIFGVAMNNADFTTPNTLVSAQQKLDQLGQQIGLERGETPLDLIPFDSENRASQIPFRGNPSDVAFVDIAGQTKLYIPLGGDLMTPGNEIAVATLGQTAARRIAVGVRPQRLAVHPDGLVFVCNQFSNYISIIDARTDDLLRNNSGEPIEIATEFYCADILLTDRNAGRPDRDEQELYVANNWRGTVLRYSIDLVRDAVSNQVVDITINRKSNDPANTPTKEITGVGANPYRLSLSEDKSHLYVANNRGGELARVRLSDDTAVARIALNAPSIDAVHIGDRVFVPTTMPDRGLPSDDELALPAEVLADPARVTGLDSQTHVAHPGALFDKTRSYNFEDIRNGLFDLEFTLSGQAVYFTDDVSSEPRFVQQQKVLSGAIPQAIVRNRAGNRIYLAHSGSDLVQELRVDRNGAFRVRALNGRSVATSERPFALAVNEDRNELYVATWGGEVVEVFDLNNLSLRQRINLGYAQPVYPATNIERGEYFFYNADWSNNGRKSCATCHLDELLVDGVGYANGATAPTAYHQVKANFNQMTTSSYFWNGSFNNGSYASLAFAAQTRTNCELILNGFIEGPGSNPATRVGDPNNRVTSADDPLCRPVFSSRNQILPDNFDQIAAVIADQKQIAAQLIQAETGFTREEVSRFSDFYTLSELRLPPNPLKFMKENGMLSLGGAGKIDQGQTLFTSQGCANCHDPNNQRHPFADGKNHGAGANWVSEFINIYQNDPLIQQIGGLPDQLVQAVAEAGSQTEPNIHLNIDFFVPFVMDSEHALRFDDPLQVRGNRQLEAERLDLLIRINLGDPDRGFVPGNVTGRPSVNTPSLRGAWWLVNYLRHGHARSIEESILGPGHPALREGEKGYAVNSIGQFDVHGQTSTLSADQVEALRLYVETIE